MGNLIRRLSELEARSGAESSRRSIMVVFVDRHEDGRLYEYDGILFHGNGRRENINGPWRLSPSSRTESISTAIQGAKTPDLYR